MNEDYCEFEDEKDDFWEREREWEREYWEDYDGDESADEREGEGVLIADDLNNPVFGKDERVEFTAKDIYDVLESVVYYNYVSRKRYDEESECCCCGSARHGGQIVCDFCMDIWIRLEKIDFYARERLYDQIAEWIRQKHDYSFRLFLSVCSKDIGIFIKDDRKMEAVNQLVRCLKRIEMMKLAESRYVDDLIRSVAKRWNIAEMVL